MLTVGVTAAPLSRRAGIVSGFLIAAIGFDTGHAAPLDVRNHHPVQLTAIHAPARASTPLVAGSREGGAHFDLTSLWALVGRGADQFEQDGETNRLELWQRFSLPFTGRLDLELRIAALYASGGSLDSTIEDWHSFWGLPQNRRDEAPRDRFTIAARRLHKGQRETIYALTANTTHLADIPIFLTGFPRALSYGGWQGGWRAGLELPAGDDKAGAGSGGIDAYLGALFGGPAWGGRLDMWTGYSWVHTPAAATRTEFRYHNPLHAGLAYQHRVFQHTQLQLQTTWEQSLLADLREPHASRDHWLLWLGVQQRVSRTLRWEFAFSEDLIPDVSPDITFHLGLRWNG